MSEGRNGLGAKFDRGRNGAGRRAAIIAGGALGGIALFAPSAGAATFTVDTLADQDDNSCADGDCSLRDAAYAANNASGADVITFASGLSGQITLTDPDGDIELYDAVSIDGPGADVLAVSGNDATQIFYFNTGGNGTTYYDITISGLTVRDGHSASGGGALYGAQTELHIVDSVFTSNEAAGRAGGAIHGKQVDLVVSNSVFTDNTGNGNEGGALYLSSTRSNYGSSGGELGITISDSVFTDNSNSGGGGAIGIDGSDASVLIERTTISGNDATIGGGLRVLDLVGGNYLTIDATTIAGNDAGTAGGLYLVQMDGDTEITNSTISGNTAERRGGGVMVYLLGPGATVAVKNSTVAGNVAGTYPTGDYGGGGIYLDDPGPIELSSTIVADNSADSGPDLAQETGSAGFAVSHSLIEDPSDATIANGGSNIFGTDPQLGPLANNGGPTQTQLPSLSSPALEAGVANGLDTDQRGLARTSDLQLVPNKAGSDGTDIGAVEIQAADVEAECQGAVVRRLAGSDGGETVTGTDNPESIFGLGGDDTLAALGANDCLSGDAGNDTADGGAGIDLVGGGAGDDLLAGGLGNDRFAGGAGDDQLVGGDDDDAGDGDDGDDLIAGGDGDDLFAGQAGADVINGESGDDQLAGSVGADKLNGGAGKDTLKGAGGKDKLKGAGGKDNLNGGGGKDKINPGNGRDKVRAAGGKDKINTADGKKDKLNCGGGKDKAKVDQKDKVKANCDVVKVKGGQ
jgi:CSLREA domain-containing protein